MARIDGYRGLFITGSLVFMLIAAAPTLGLFIRIPDGSEEFSELWLLGPEGEAENYPFNVSVDESYSVYVGVGNHLDHSAYYRIYVKFRNQTQPLPTASNSSPSILPPLYEFDIFVRDNEVWEELFGFTVLEVFSINGTMLLKSLQVNGFVFQVNGLSLWDEDERGFYFQLFFELWLYDVTSQSFDFHDRFVGIWLNMTSS